MRLLIELPFFVAQLAVRLLLAYAPLYCCGVYKWTAVFLLCTGLRPDFTFCLGALSRSTKHSALTTLECRLLGVDATTRYPHGWLHATWKMAFGDAPHLMMEWVVSRVAPWTAILLSVVPVLTGHSLRALVDPVRDAVVWLGARKHESFGTSPNAALPMWDAQWFAIFYATYWIFSLSLSFALTHCSVVAENTAERVEMESSTSTLSAKVPRGLVTYLRLSNRLLASLVMFTLPIWIFFFQADRRVDYFNPWMSGSRNETRDWCEPTHPMTKKSYTISLLETRLVQFQFMYYIVDTPLTLFHRDFEQIFHHIIGLGMLLPPMVLTICYMPVLSGLWSEQGISIWVRFTKLQRYFLPKYNAVERTLVHMNFYQNAISFLMFSLPLFLGGAFYAFRAIASQWGLHAMYLRNGWVIDDRTESGLIAFVAFWIGAFILWQAMYDLYWQTRLYASYGKYQDTVREHRLVVARKEK
jgi:hypothetical protein